MKRDQAKHLKLKEF